MQIQMYLYSVNRSNTVLRLQVLWDSPVKIQPMANAGIKSTQSGTSMRSIITVLSGEVKFCSESFWEMEIATTNSDGSMRSLFTILTICRMQKLHSSKQKIRTLHFCPQMTVLYHFDSGIDKLHLFPLFHRV